MPELSVIVPVRNGERFLAEAIESLLPHRDVDEIVVVDDGSTDRSTDIARRYPVVLLRQPGAGSAAARNAGLAVARGAVIGFLDADDLWAPPRPEGDPRLARLRAEPHTDLVLGRTVRFRTGDRGPEPLGPPEPFLALGALLVRREALSRVGPLDPAIAVSDDIDWLLRAQEAGIAAVRVDETVLWYRRHASSLTASIAARERGVLSAARAAIARRRRDAS